jgi:hypothetical protein
VSPQVPTRALAGAAAFLLLGACASSLSPFSPDLSPRPLDPVERGEYHGPPPRVTGEPTAAVGEVEALARVFYTRVINRRFNSISTFHDPALRELFATPEAFADYYAALSDALDAAHFEALRPSAVDILQLDVLESDAVLVTVRYHGQNSLPLRFWSVDLERTDRLERSDGRWWIIPGKL